MKKKFSKILGVGLTLALLTSLLLTAAPVSADVSDVTVSVTPATISKAADYTILFKIHDDLTTASDSVTIVFPEGTDASALHQTANVVSIQTSIGIWGGVAEGPVTVITGTDVTVVDKVTLTILLDDLTQATVFEGAWIEIVTLTTVVVNPADPGEDYTLTVETNIEDTAVVSAEYEIEPPKPTTPAGVVEVWNPSDILMENYTGDDAIDVAYNNAGDNYVISVGAGRYEWNNSFDDAWEGVTIVSAAGADETLIVGDTGVAVYINDLGVTLDDFTISQVGSYGVDIDSDGDEVIIQNNVFIVEEVDTQDEDHMYVDDATDVVVQDNTFTVEATYWGIYTWATEAKFINNDFILADGAFGLEIDDTDTEATGNTFTGSGGLGILVYDGIITDNIFDGLETGIDVNGENVTIEGNTFQNGADGAAILVTYIGTKAVITNNTFTANADYVLNVVVNANADLVYMNFNSILGDNTGDDDGYVLFNADGVLVVNAQANWWGDVTGPDTAIFNDAALFNYEPFLIAATSGDGTADAATQAFDAEDDNGVTVTVTETVDDGDTVDEFDMVVVGSATYAANPAGTAPTGAVGYWDVFVGSVEDDVTEITIRIYTDVTLDTEVHVWAVGKGEWLPASSVTPNLFGGFMSIVVDADSTPTIEDLAGLPFVVVEPPVEEELDTPLITSPTSGAADVSLKPTLAWGTVDNADGYDFELAGNPLFVLPLVSLTGDVGRLIAPFYAQVTPLEYSTYYYWRVKAVSADGESAWSPAVFYTVAEVIPEPEVPPVWTCPQCGLDFATRDALAAHAATAHPAEEPPEIIIESPDIIVPLPAETPITPAWIYVIIGVGAVLVLALIVLIVRTRRVA